MKYKQFIWYGVVAGKASHIYVERYLHGLGNGHTVMTNRTAKDRIKISLLLLKIYHIQSLIDLNWIIGRSIRVKLKTWERGSCKNTIDGRV